MAQAIIKSCGGKYYNWDLAEDRSAILSSNFIHDKIVTLDELHKYDRWKGFIKGIYDKYHEELKVLITGSARMDVYQKGGDSLLGRYFLFHLHPLTVGELLSPEKIPRPDALRSGEITITSSGDLSDLLMKFGGFPEPFYTGSEEAHHRWSLQRQELLVREDIRDLTNINLLTLIEHLMMLLPARVGSVLSVNALKEDLRVAYNTVQAWLNTFEKLFLIFTLRPYDKKIHRTVHKERKIYLWDWSQIKNEGALFENFVASHLWKAVTFWRDLGFGDFGLHFLRDRDRREVDFCITLDNNPWLLVEAKLSDSNISENLDYFSERLGVPAVQVLKTSGIDKKRGNIRTVSADRWLSLLP